MLIRDLYLSNDALGLAALVSSKEVSASELLEQALALCDERDPRLHAVVHRFEDRARQEIERGLPEGPFRGVPFLLKDLHIALAGEPMTNGSRLYRDHVPTIDSTLTERYRAAGLVIFGRTASPEFGLTTTTESLLYGPTYNPWDLDRTAGGSSGGAAAAVASGILPLAHASDGGGSIRIPASCCGLFGLKPTRGRVPPGPEVGEGWAGLSTNHAVSWSVRDSAALLDAVAGPAPGDPYYAPPIARPYLEEVGQDPGRLRIAFTLRSFNGAPTHPDCERAVRNAAMLCESLGHDVFEGRPEVDADALREVIGVIIGANIRATAQARAAELGRELDPANDLEEVTWGMIQSVEDVGAAAYPAGVKVIHQTGRKLAAFFDSCDLLLTPTMAQPPARIGELALTGVSGKDYMPRLLASVGFTQLMNIAGNPAVSVPLAHAEDGIPIGVQFAAPFGGEDRLFRLAAQLEAAAPWAGRRP